MPVRIYDISKKLGLENKEVLAKAKELGIAARVASSSLDKITAEYLEQQLVLAHPERSVAPAPTPVETPAQPISGPCVITAPPIEAPSTVQVHEVITSTSTAVLEAPAEVPSAPTLAPVEVLAPKPAPQPASAPETVMEPV